MAARGIDRPKSAEDLYALAMELVASGATSADLARKLSLPTPHAIKLHADLFGRIWPGVATRFDPSVMPLLKDEMIESNLKTIRWVDGKIDDKSVTAKEANAKNGAMKVLGKWAGFDAPIRIETTDRTLFALVNPAVHARIMADPAAREAMLVIEEFAAGSASNPIDVTPQGPGGDP